jgi:hypothetical protein
MFFRAVFAAAAAPARRAPVWAVSPWVDANMVAAILAPPEGPRPCCSSVAERHRRAAIAFTDHLALQAHPFDLWQVAFALMQESPHALPLLQTLQQLCEVVGGAPSAWPIVKNIAQHVAASTAAIRFLMMGSGC